MASTSSSRSRVTSLFLTTALVSLLVACGGTANPDAPSDAGSDVPFDGASSDDHADAKPDAPAHVAKCGMASSNDACTACLESKCCAAAKACADDAACTDALRAARRCAGEGCSPPEVPMAGKTLDACLFASCRDECGGTAPSRFTGGFRGAGDPCMNKDSCLTGTCSAAHACTRSCASDSDCAGYPDVPGKGTDAVCVATASGAKVCLPRCDTEADCDARVVKIPTGLSAKTENLRCADVGASRSVCVLARDTGATPACYAQDATLDMTGCSSDADCLCGQSCTTDGGDLPKCLFTCTDNASCSAKSGGVVNLCFKASNGDTHCAN